MSNHESKQTDKPTGKDRQIGEPESTDRWNQKTAKDYRDALQEGAIGMIPEIDSMQAAVEKGFRELIPHSSNEDIIKEANRLNDKLVAPGSEVGPLQKSAIAETLLEMHKEMENRLGQAPRDKSGLPQLDGVVWDNTSPLKGIVEDIKPFGMVDQWGGFVLPTEPKSRRIEARKANESAPNNPKAVTPTPGPRPEHPDAARHGAKIGEEAKLPEPLPKESPRDHARDFPLRPPKPSDAPIIIGKMARKIVEGIAQIQERNIQEARALGTSYSVSILDGDLRKTANPHIERGQPYDKNGFYRDVRYGVFRQDIDRNMPYLRLETGEKAERAIRQSTDTFVDAANQVLASAKTPQQRKSAMETFTTAAAREVSKNLARRR